MIRNLKVLGLALVAVFAMSSLVASAASAGQLGAGSGLGEEDVTLTGVETKGGPDPNAFTAFGGKTECPETIYTGHEPEITPHQFLVLPAPEVTVTPHYKGCVTTDAGGNKFSTTVDMNGCDYLLTVGETTEKVGTYGADVHVICPAGKSIQVTLFSGGAHSLKLCTLTINTTTPVSDAHLTNTAGIPEDVDLVGTFTKIKSTKSGLCGSTSEENGVLDIDVTLTAVNTEGTPVDITVED
ncbi:MAG TPA: hypothetical protein VFM94_10880 [Solirubrobacterales bacterium]|nr:hypothetical protein [Solirubrobacterales bacterium]